MANTAEDAYRAAKQKEAETKAAVAAAKAEKDKFLADLEALLGPNGALKVGTDEYGNLFVYEPDKQSGRTPKYLWITPDGKGSWNIDRQSETQIIASVKSQFKGNLESLRKSLYTRGYMSEKEYITKSESGFNGAILQSAKEHSVEQAQKYTVEKSTAFSSYNSWLSGKGAYTTDKGVDTEKVTTPRAEADQDLDKFFNDMLGRDATVQEKNLYFNKLSAAEKTASRKRTVSGTTGTTVDTLLNEDDLYKIRVEILRPSVAGTKLEDLTAKGGKIAQDISSLKEYAAAYGIKYDTKTALNAVMGGMVVGKEASLESQKNSIKEQSKAFYKNLSDLIDRGVKVSDIANQFAYYKGQMLETPDNAYDAFDPEIQTALQNSGKDGVMSITDFERLIRTSPATKSKWLQTKKAKEEASNYATNILRMFGLMA